MAIFGANVQNLLFPTLLHAKPPGKFAGERGVSEHQRQSIIGPLDTVRVSNKPAVLIGRAIDQARRPVSRKRLRRRAGRPRPQRAAPIVQSRQIRTL